MQQARAVRSVPRLRVTIFSKKKRKSTDHESMFIFIYCCSVPVVPPFSPLFIPTPSPQLPQSISPIVHAHESSICVPLLVPSPSVPRYPPPLWSPSVYSLCPSLWFYFAHLFDLLLRFHLKARLYGICPSPPGLFHLA